MTFSAANVRDENIPGVCETRLRAISAVVDLWTRNEIRQVICSQGGVHISGQHSCALSAAVCNIATPSAHFLIKPRASGSSFPAETRRCPNADLMLIQRCRRWTNIKSVLGQRRVPHNACLCAYAALHALPPMAYELDQIVKCSNVCVAGPGQRRGHGQERGKCPCGRKLLSIIKTVHCKG